MPSRPRVNVKPTCRKPGYIAKQALHSTVRQPRHALSIIVLLKIGDEHEHTPTRMCHEKYREDKLAQLHGVCQRPAPVQRESAITPGEQVSAHI